MTKQIQNFFDDIIEKIFFWAIPNWIKPNYFSYLRIFLVPVVYLLLEEQEIGWGLFIFFVAACTDFIDGALARKRNQITDLGKLLDPIADKLLIAIVLVFLGMEYLVVKLFLIVIGLEIAGIIASTFFAYKIGRPVGANVFGKIKMVLQTFSVVIFLIGLILNQANLITFSEWTLFIALIFALIAAYKQVASKWNNLLSALGIVLEKKTIKNIIKKM